MAKRQSLLLSPECGLLRWTEFSQLPDIVLFLDATKSATALQVQDVLERARAAREDDGSDGDDVSEEDGDEASFTSQLDR
mmetsp:Transcript_13525/g.26574  ORF Transcript_13525/g.26574 Transcript_13525/m.26574 type:complete len:80 (+) Transcript_13525:97-336(+)